MLSVAEAAAALGVGERRVRRLIADGKLDAARVGRAWVVAEASVATLARSRPRTGRPLAGPNAWRVLASIDGSLQRQDPTIVIADRRLRHRHRHALSARPQPAEWATWLRRRGETRRVWVHPGSVDNVVSDERTHSGPTSPLPEVHVGDLAPIYVQHSDFAGVISDHHGVVDPAGAPADALTMVLVAPLPVDIVWHHHLGAAVVVDLSRHADARLRAAALRQLEAADALLGPRAKDPSLPG